MELINKYETKKTNKIKIIHHGMDERFITNTTPELINEFSKRYDLAGKTVIGTISRYVEMKGYIPIIEAAKIICKQNKNIVFIGIGDGHQKDELQALIDKYELENNFILTGKIHYDLIPASYKNMTIFLHNAINEAFGFVFPEAMFNKIPIVSTNVGAIRDVLTHKENCYKVNINDPEDIVNGINFILNNNSSDLAEKAYEICKKEFTIRNMWDNYRELFLKEN
jgi:glycosyltransferase involved in cell wall biosynthesis